jgi:hypothetical protein
MTRMRIDGQMSDLEEIKKFLENGLKTETNITTVLYIAVMEAIERKKEAQKGIEYYKLG